MATVIIPAPLRKFTDNTIKLTIEANKVSEVVLELTTTFPSLKKHLIDSEGKITSFINIFVGNDDIRNLNREQTEIDTDTVISIIPAIAGGTDFPYKIKSV